MKKIFLSAGVALALVGCASNAELARKSGSVIGCLPSNIEISDKKYGDADYYVATCKGVSYYCNTNEFRTQCAKID